MVCTGSLQASPSASQQVINVSAQPRATLAPQNATAPRPAISQPIIIPRGAVSICYVRFIFLALCMTFVKLSNFISGDHSILEFFHRKAPMAALMFIFYGF